MTSAGAATSDGGLCDLPAVQLAGMVARRELSARELLDAHQRRLDLLDPLVNAVVTRTPERAAEMAARADQHLAGTGTTIGPLHGLPVAHKDIFAVAGVRTTYGSPIFADNIPTFDQLSVQRQHLAGAVMVGKTNTPEFGAGSQTFNQVFGITRNPYDLALTCGGSSGGAAVALRCGMIALADGSDMGGSLRNPAAFCNVVGLRPSPGRVPSVPSRNLWGTLSVEGPMGRTVADVALLLSVLAGEDVRAPLSMGEAGSYFAPPLQPAALAGLRVAYCPSLGGLPVDPAVKAVVDAVATALATHGARVEPVEPALGAADEIFETTRAFQFDLGWGGVFDRDGDRMKATVRDNVLAGRALHSTDLVRAEVLRAKLFAEMTTLFEGYDVLLGCTTQVPPFPVEQEWVSEIDGVALEGYLAWMRSCSRVTVTSCPALSLPGGFTPDGRPVGVQLVGPYRRERRLLEIAAACEALLDAGTRRPAIVEQLA